jgi:hypothetical protein
MVIAHFNDQVTALAASAALLLTVALGGCASSTVGPSPMDARADASAPPKTGGYPSVEEPPPGREGEGMTADERLKLKNELIATRDRQTAPAKAQGAAGAKPAKPRAVQPTNQAVQQ